MSDSFDGGAGSGPDQQPTTPPRPPGGPRYAGDALRQPGAPPAPGSSPAPGEAPPGFAGPLPPANPYQTAVPSVPARPAPTKHQGNAGPILIVLALLIVAAGAGYWFVVRDDSDPAKTPTTAQGIDPAPGGPGEAAQEFFTAVMANDDEVACTRVGQETLDAIEAEGKTCKDLVSKIVDTIELPNGKPLPVVVLSEKIDGDRAEVDVRVTEASSDQPAILVRESGMWKLDLLASADDDPASVDTGPATTQACETELRTVQTAVEAYYAVNGEYPPDAQALVGRFLEEAPTRAKVGPDGTVTPAGDCA